MDEYKQKTLAMIRDHSDKLSSKTDNQLADLYREWSNVIASANWLMHSEIGVDEFCKWATVAPCDR